MIFRSYLIIIDLRKNEYIVRIDGRLLIYKKYVDFRKNIKKKD